MKVRVPEDVVSRAVAGETVILDLASGNYFGLDDVGTRVWDLLVRHGDSDVAVRALLDEFAVDEPTLRRDVEKLVAELAAEGLVERDEPASPASR